VPVPAPQVAPPRPDPGGAYELIGAAVRRIPRGRVSTYGSIARIAAASGARQVGYAMHALNASSTVPWHRVINAQGRVSLPGAAGAEQRARLRAEGVLSDARGRIDLARYGWTPPEIEPSVKQRSTFQRSMGQKRFK